MSASAAAQAADRLDLVVAAQVQSCVTTSPPIRAALHYACYLIYSFSILLLAARFHFNTRRPDLGAGQSRG